MRRRQAALSAAAGVLIGLVGGTGLSLYLSREKPAYVEMSIKNTTFTAGEAIQIDRKLLLPSDCIPRTMRWLHYDSGHQEGLTDIPQPPDGVFGVPTSPRLPPGCGEYHETVVAIGCGWGSGMFKPLGASSRPLHICVTSPKEP